jgi:CRISPR-associated protein Cas2
MRERLYFVTYDICEQKRWRQVFKTMKGYGEWVQLSVFQCRMSPRRLARMRAELDPEIDHNADQVVIIDLGPADQVAPRIESLGRPVDIVERRATIL